MTVMEFIAKLVDSIAWPTAILVVTFIFRRELTKVLQRLTRLKYKDLDMEFERAKQQAEMLNLETQASAESATSPKLLSLEDQIDEAVERAPSAAILLAWSSVETAIDAAVARLNLQPPTPSYRSVSHSIQLLSTRTNLSKEHANLLQELRQIRNKVAHENDTLLSITHEQAANYSKVALDLSRFIENLRRKRNGD